MIKKTLTANANEKTEKETQNFSMDAQDKQEGREANRKASYPVYPVHRC